MPKVFRIGYIELAVLRNLHWTMPIASAVALVGPGPVSAADLSYKAPAPVQTVGSWTGFYAGLNGGGGFGSTGANEFGMRFGELGFPGAMGVYDLGHTMSGGLAGGQAGVNWQINNWVWGFEADLDWANIGGRQTISGPVVAANNGGNSFPGNFVTASQTIDAFGTVRARAGFLARPDLLLYGTAGLAYGDVGAQGDFHLHRPDAFRDFGASGHAFQVGWTAGAGVEYRFAPHWTVKGEYLYYDLGNHSLTSDYGTPTMVRGFQSQYDFATHGSIARVGVNYHWDAAPDGVAVATPGMPVKALKAPPPLVLSPWIIEVGARYFYSSGRTRYTLGHPFVPGQVNSQLTYKNLGSHAGEAFARLDHLSGFFAKGFVGAGNINGSINDEDFPPAMPLYSNTVSNVNNGSQAYGTVDAGYNFWKGQPFKVGGFLGYNRFYENVNAYGCTQVAGNPSFCSAAVSGSVLGLSKTETWDSLRVGLNGVINLAPQWKLTLDGAYLPFVHLSGFDNHWMRPDINPEPQSGDGWGYQLEGIVSYDVTQNFSVGAGGRYWYAKTDNGTSKVHGVLAVPTTFTYERFGGFLQASYKFGEPPAGASGTEPNSACHSACNNWALTHF
ncbi:opacity protein-like surface antigen [Bradyrhizobium sp. JR7.2]|uniref:outer membrane beta-barrel protein n=1 Tax=unclassified Bradyrhizobium TaxID=2631580 RepID=UPI003396DCE7